MIIEKILSKIEKSENAEKLKDDNSRTIRKLEERD